ncbi:MAG TPA: hypothetical protein VIZ32_14905 [Vicinamibacterales bacterium]
MNQTSYLRASARWLAAGVGVTAAAYGAYVGITWLHYGDAAPPSAEEQDPLLDRFMPSYDVAERHHVRVAAPAAVTLAAAQEMDLLHSPSVRAIIKARELILGAKPDDRRRPRGLLAEVQSLGWGVLAEVPGREIVVGGVTKPWEANPTFRALPPDEFQGFSEDDFVKIVWTLRADPVGTAESIFRTETRVRTTDPAARAKFRRYWSFLSPGIILIRWISLGPLKAEAERRARAEGSSTHTERLSALRSR